MVKTLAKGERLPKHKFKQHNYMTAEHNVYNLFDDNEKLIATLYKPRWQHLPRKIEFHN